MSVGLGVRVGGLVEQLRRVCQLGRVGLIVGNDAQSLIGATADQREESGGLFLLRLREASSTHVSNSSRVMSSG